jgi:hypothetical protein
MTPPLKRHEFQADRLIKEYPPRWNGRNKLTVFDIACSCPHPFDGHIIYSRWREEMPPERISQGSCNFTSRKGIFEYGEPDHGSAVWHMNFADPDLFVAYSGSLLAQDELQVSEHPVLGSLREALEATGVLPRTVDYNGHPTPITISGVQRRCAIETKPTAKCPRGLYGNEFRHADEMQVEAATKPVTPPTMSNILAMAAPSCGSGIYRQKQLAYVLNTASTGYAAAKRESAQIGSPTSRVVVHTGFWGCGAFGGNRTLMTILQSLAADLAEIDLVFWSFDDHGLRIVENARTVYSRLVASSNSTRDILASIEKMGFEWGESDGN